MDLTTLGFAMGSAWLSGINLYATVLTLGLLQRFHLAHLPGDLGYLSNEWVIGVAAAMYVIEFIADKVPAVDSAWDAIHTFIRIPAGAILAATAFAHFDPQVRLLALLIGGGIALSSHSAKSATRLAANVSPEPFSNVALSLLEDVTTVGGTLLMAVHPVVLIGIVLAAVVSTAFFIRWISRSLKRRFGRKANPVTA
ncbi:MAG TPA: DUF4126 domain-containing protein [Bryobacteraceae bacterium]|nr:DUF4126 domain-containing protein [Bryobacteraceae bacterium]